MKLAYTEPEMQIRKYSLPPSDLITTSGPGSETDLGDNEDFGELFG